MYTEIRMPVCRYIYMTKSVCTCANSYSFYRLHNYSKLYFKHCIQFLPTTYKLFKFKTCSYLPILVINSSFKRTIIFMPLFLCPLFLYSLSLFRYPLFPTFLLFPFPLIISISLPLHFLHHVFSFFSQFFMGFFSFSPFCLFFLHNICLPFFLLFFLLLTLFSFLFYFPLSYCFSVFIFLLCLFLPFFRHLFYFIYFLAFLPRCSLISQTFNRSIFFIFFCYFIF